VSRRESFYPDAPLQPPPPPKAVKEAATALLETVTGQTRFNDDTSIVVLDLLPEGVESFPVAVSAAASRRSGSRVVSDGGGGDGGSSSSSAPSEGMTRTPSKGLLFSCFRSEAEMQDSRDAVGPGHLVLYADVDCLKVRPNPIPSCR